MRLKLSVNFRPCLSALTLGFCLIAAGVFVAARTPSRMETGQSADVEVKKKVDVWVAMWNSYDLSQVDNLFLTNDHLTYFSSEKEGAIRGIEAIRKHHEGFGFVKGGKAQKNKLWLENLRIDVFGETAVVTGVWFFERAEAVPGKDKIQSGPVTAVYVKQNGEYRIAHMNFGNYKSK